MRLQALLVLALGLAFSGLTGAQQGSTPKDEAPWLKNLHQLTFEGKRSGEGYFSPDAREIVYQAVRDDCPHYQIYVQSLETGEARRISPGKGMTTCSYFHPTNGTVLFASTHLDPTTWPPPPANAGKYAWDRHASFDLFTVKRDGTGLMRLTDAPGYDAEANFSRDGQWIVFTSQRTGDAEIYTMKSDGTQVRRVTNVKGYDGGPFFSPDGRQICFRGFRDLRPGMERFSQVYIIDRDGGNERQMTFNTAVNWAPYYHPNGKYLVYCTNIGGFRNFEIVLMRISDAKVVRLTQDPSVDIMPVFSPDGKKLMWTTTRFGDKSQLVIADFVMPPADAFVEPYRDPPGGVKRPSREGHAPPERKKASEGASASTAEGDPVIDGEDALRTVSHLASDDLQGRRSGTQGCTRAAAWLADRFRELGLEPAGTKGFFQSFDVTAGFRPRGRNHLSLQVIGEAAEGVVLPLDTDWRPLSFTADGEAAASAVFVGYGITSADGSWDDYKDVDAKGKIVVCFLRGEPGLEAKDRVDLGRYAGARYKAFNAARHGAAGVVFVGDSRQRAGLEPLGAGGGEGREKLPVVQVTRKAALPWLGRSGLDLDAAERRMSAEGRSLSKELPNLVVSLTTGVEKIRAATANVVAMVRGSDPGLADEYLVVGAHYDHLGLGGEGSLAPGGGVGEVHNGADDNASGVAGLMELAESFAKKPARHSVVFMAFSGEEEGLLGSQAWLDAPTLPLGKCVAMVNLDMIGRLGDAGLVVDGVATWKGFRELVERANITGIKIGMTAGSMSGRSDHASFIAWGIPAIHLFTGAHVDYHRPSDDVEKLNMAGLIDVTRLVRRIVDGLDAVDDVVVFQKPPVAKRDVKRRGSGVWLGTIPAYTQEEGGVLLQGASPGSPAEAAGIKKDDILVGFDDVEVNNIYDFVNALRSRKPGDKVKLVVKRDGKRVELEATLGRR